MKYSLGILLLFLFFTSCKNDDSNPTLPIQTQDAVTDYFPLEVGNYWIYQHYRADSTLVFINQNITDSVYVEKDTVVSGNTYKVLRSSFLNDVFLIRDSADCLVLPNGQKIFSLNQSNELLAKVYYPENDTTYVLVWKMNPTDSVCNVPSGQYTARYVNGILNSTDPNNPTYRQRNLFYAYSKNIGWVSRRLCFLGAEVYLEERLLRFHLNTK